MDKKIRAEETVSKKEGSQFLSNGEDAVAVCNIQGLKGRGSGTVNRV